MIWDQNPNARPIVTSIITGAMALIVFLPTLLKKLRRRLAVSYDWTRPTAELTEVAVE